MYYRKNEDGSLLDWCAEQYSDECLFTEKEIVTAWNGLTYISGEEPKEPEVSKPSNVELSQEIEIVEKEDEDTEVEVDGKEVEMIVKVGDRVITSKYSGTEVKIDGEELKIVRQSDILAIVE